jgi:ORF6N domain
VAGIVVVMSTVPAETAIDIATRILNVRGQRVLLDSQLAALYGVTTKRPNEQVRRNIDRFLDDFLFALTAEELESVNPMNSARAVQMSVYVVRAFVKLRQALASPTAFARRMEALERSVAALDDQVYEAILGVMGSGPRRN